MSKFIVLLLFIPSLIFSQLITSVNKIDVIPTIDGEVINDPAWNVAKAISTFIQKTPDEGDFISEKTIVKVMYSEKYFYVSVVAYDKNPEGIVISDTRRDASLNNSDSFSFVIDTFKDYQTGYLFGTNPAGIEFDAQITGGGEGGSISRRFSVGSGGGFNINWDAVWEVKTKRGDYGWSAEFAIPFKTLRYKKDKDQSWGINFERVIARKKEESHWSPISRQFTMNRLVSAGTIEGINVPISKNIKIMPYVLGQKNEIIDTLSSSDSNTNVGMDAKVSVGSSMTLDLTYNTDFAQVEADEQQINLDRFSLFFPEKRAFFLENAGLFSIGSGGGYSGPDIEMFFSRRIGVGLEGIPVPIIGGGRLTGTLSGMKIGLLSMVSDEVADVTGKNNYSVLRLKKELPNRTHIGGMYTALDHQGKNGYLNQSYAIDAQLGLGELSKLVGFVGLTDTPGLNNDNAYAYKLEAARDAKEISSSLSYTEVGANFNPEMGYLKRENYRKWSGRIFTRFRPQNKFGILEIRPHINYDGYWKLDGFQESGRWHIDNHWEFRSGFEIHTGMNLVKEGVLEVFEISEGINIEKGTYDYNELQIMIMTNNSKAISFSSMNRIGGFFGGERINMTPAIKIRYRDHFTSEFSYNYNKVELTNGNFTTKLLRARLTYAISPKVYIQSLLQYNNQSDQWSMNWRFILQQSAATGLYIVYNQTQDYDGIPIIMNTKSFALKYSYLFDVFN